MRVPSINYDEIKDSLTSLRIKELCTARDAYISAVQQASLFLNNLCQKCLKYVEIGLLQSRFDVGRSFTRFVVIFILSDTARRTGSVPCIPSDIC